MHVSCGIGVFDSRSLSSACRYLVAYTTNSLLLGDLSATPTARISEVRWSATGKERFHLEHPAVCLLFAAGELHLIEVRGGRGAGMRDR
jgi:hypothetical protein